MRYGNRLAIAIVMASLCGTAWATEARVEASVSGSSLQGSAGAGAQASAGALAVSGAAAIHSEAATAQAALEEARSELAGTLQVALAREVSGTVQAAIVREIHSTVQAEVMALVSVGR